MIEIKNRYTGAVLKTIEGANLRGANLRGANLRSANLRSADLEGADLYGANLRGANLRGANLEGADLYGADLYGADLRGADLRSADLDGANLRSADLDGANLEGANLRGANLRGANLRSANLRSADLRGADLEGVRDRLGIDFDPTLPARIVAQIEARPETHDQTTWHSACGTRHCIAGFATHLSGALGKYLDTQLGTSTAATLLLWRPGVVLPSFAANATDEETIGRLRAMAAAAAEEAQK